MVVELVRVTIDTFSVSILLCCIAIHVHSHFIFHIQCRHTSDRNIQFRPRQNSLAFYPLLWTLYQFFLLISSSAIVLITVLTINDSMVNLGMTCIIVVTSICESLLSFHRYYTLNVYMSYKRKSNTTQTLKRFCLFAVLYIILFVSALWTRHWLYVLIVLYVCFNIFCQCKFAQMLLKQYSIEQSFDDISAANIQYKMIQSVHTMCWCSIISICINAVPIYCAFINQQILFPLCWSLSSSLYMFNFVRNRDFITNAVKTMSNFLWNICSDLVQKTSKNKTDPQANLADLCIDLKDLPRLDKFTPTYSEEPPPLPAKLSTSHSTPFRKTSKCKAKLRHNLSNPILSPIESEVEKSNVHEVSLIEKHSYPFTCPTPKHLDRYISDPVIKRNSGTIKLLEKYDMNESGFNYMDDFKFDNEEGFNANTPNFEDKGMIKLEVAIEFPSIDENKILNMSGPKSPLNFLALLDLDSVL